MKRFLGALTILILAVGLFFIFYLYRGSESKIFLVGDMSFDRYIRQSAEKNGEDFLFSCITGFLSQADLVVANLEGPITDKASISRGSVVGSPENFTFTFPPSSAKLLYKQNIKLVNLGNNHSDDFGKAGLVSTQKYLSDAGVDYFGGVFGDEPIIYKKVGGIDFAFISYNQFGGESRDKIVEKIKKEKLKEKTVIVYTHWGEEYVSPNTSIKDTAKLFAKNGADFVIGSHPHVILSSEKIGQTIVYYSLGNFLFDQYWNNEVSTGLLLELNIKSKDITVVEHKVSLGHDGRTCLAK